MRMLIVEDDPDVRELLKIGFQSEGFVIDMEKDGERGSYTARTNDYDIVILDYSLPKKDGYTVCNEIRKHGKDMPIIFLSIIRDPQKKIDVLVKGADDYLTKPFSFEELKARVHAILRRPKKIERNFISLGEISINTQKQIAHRNGRAIYLTRKEYCLLEYFMKNPDTVLSRGMILEHVWDRESDPFSNTIEAHILNLRKKINVGEEKELLKNVPGRGYIFIA